MASGITTIIYPSGDLNVNHSKSSTASAAYLLINDTTPDDNTNYIYQTLSSTSATVTSSFNVAADPSAIGKLYLTGVTVNSRAYVTNGTASVQTAISINNGDYTTGATHSLSDSYTNYTDTFSGVSGLNRIYESVADANITIQVITNGNSDAKFTTNHARITTANVTIIYSDVWTCYAYYIPGTGISSVNVSKTEVIDGEETIYTAVLEDKYVFEGWYADDAGTILVSESQTYTATVNSNLILYAKGSLLYNITLYADEHCSVISSKDYAPLNAEITVTANFDQTKYKFDGWYSNEARTSLVSADNPYIFNIVSNTVLYAKCVSLETMFVKLGGDWHKCSAVYKKIDGIWVEQTELNNLFDTTKNYKIIDID